MCAVGVHRLVAWCKPGRTAVVPLALLVTVIVAEPAIVNSYEFMDKRGTIEDACAFLDTLDEAPVALPMDTKKYTLYLEGSGVETLDVEDFRPSGPPAQVLAGFRRAGVRWMVTGPQRWHTRDPGHRRNHAFLWWDELESILETEAKLVREFPHVSDYLWEFTTEGWGLEHLQPMIESGAGPIRIYDLQASPANRQNVEFTSVSPM
jgi:hypothetical protein